MKAVTSEQMRSVEASISAKLDMPMLLLMESAAVSLAEHCMAYLSGKENPKALIMAGTGGNGGDGLALARLLHLKGIDVSVIFAGEDKSARGDTRVNLKIARGMGLHIKPIITNDDVESVPGAVEACDLVVDALFGIGLNQPLTGCFKDFVKAINSRAKFVIAVDIPSGINADNGSVMGAAVKADITVTMGYPKIGLLLYPGAEYAGKVEIAKMPLPERAPSPTGVNASFLTENEAAALLPGRPKRSNKGTFGRVYAFAGSESMPGAAAMSAAAAYKAGAGYVCACVIPSVARVLHSALKEAVTRILPDRDGFYCKESLEAIAGELGEADVVYAGPGIGRGPWVTEFVRGLIETVKVPLILDADALNAISEDTGVLKKVTAPCLITPHPGEMSRLTGLSVQDILDGTISAASNFAREFNAIALLKDARTIVASPTGHIYINTTGSPALAKAGSGDVLTGLISGFAAQGLDLYKSAQLGAYIHGKAGEAAEAGLSGYSVSASDLLEYIPKTLNRYRR